MPYTGEIRLFAGTFAPRGWAFCDGRSLPISENETLFNLIGTTYGGDGQETFDLPDLRGRLPLHQGQGPGISQSYQLAESFGVEQVTLTTQQIPSHTHAVLASRAGGGSSHPQGAVLASQAALSPFTVDAPSVNLPPAIVDGNGGSQPHDNLMPTTAINYIISLFGVYPQQT